MRVSVVMRNLVVAVSAVVVLAVGAPSRAQDASAPLASRYQLVGGPAGSYDFVVDPGATRVWVDVRQGAPTDTYTITTASGAPLDGADSELLATKADRNIKSDPLGQFQDELYRDAPEAGTYLLDAAAEIYSQVGVEGATISAITEQADVGLGTFYLHFADKDAIALAVCEVVVHRLFDDERIALEDVRSVGGDPDPLAIFARVMCARAAEGKGLLCALLRWEGPRIDIADGTAVERNELRKALNEPLIERFCVGMNSGRYRTEDPALAASAVLGVFATSIPSWVASGRTDWNALGTFIERTISGMFRR